MRAYFVAESIFRYNVASYRRPGLKVSLFKIVHFSDLHLDAQFAWAGASGSTARQRRQALRDALKGICGLARQVEADALFCGGDLYEHERFSPDTAEFLRVTFAELSPTPVYIAPGNHDWFSAKSLYALVDWTPNVKIFPTSSLESVRLADGLTLWGAAHLAPANTDNFLAGFKTEGAGIHVALFHGAENSWFSEQGVGKQPHAPFDASQIEEAGLHHVFLGHYHRPKDAERHTYPGNPEPLEFGEDGLRGAVVATVDERGNVHRERVRVGATTVHDLRLDVTGLASHQQVRDALAPLVADLEGVARLTVHGEVEPTLDIRESDLRSAMSGCDAVQIRVEDLRPGYDIEAIRSEHTVRGQFVTDVLASGLSAEEERRVIVSGLRALDGRSDLEVL